MNRNKQKTDKEIANEWFAKKFADSMGYTGKQRERAIREYLLACQDVQHDMAA